MASSKQSRMYMEQLKKAEEKKMDQQQQQQMQQAEKLEMLFSNSALQQQQEQQMQAQQMDMRFQQVHPPPPGFQAPFAPAAQQPQQFVPPQQRMQTLDDLFQPQRDQHQPERRMRQRRRSASPEEDGLHMLDDQIPNNEIDEMLEIPAELSSLDDESEMLNDDLDMFMSLPMEEEEKRANAKGRRTGPTSRKPKPLTVSDRSRKPNRRLAESSDDEEEDARIERMQILRDKPLGAGGFGTVFKGFDRIQGVHLAVKESSIQANNCALKDMHNEFKLLKELDHPHIVKVIDFKVEKNVAQIFMEWMPSGSVQSIIETNGFRLHELAVRRYALESLKGLEYLHSKDMLHRDIKPGNMLVAGNGAVKLSDFGTSRVQESTSTTQHVVGTCAYMAPETIRGKYSEGSDVWAWACSVVEMASGVMPWSELPRELRGNIQLMFHIGSAQPPNHHPALPEHLSPALTELLAKCFSFDATARPSAKELLESAYFTQKDTPANVEPLEVYQTASESQRLSSTGSSSGGMTWGASSYLNSIASPSRSTTTGGYATLTNAGPPTHSLGARAETQMQSVAMTDRVQQRVANQPNRSTRMSSYGSRASAPVGGVPSEQFMQSVQYNNY